MSKGAVTLNFHRATIDLKPLNRHNLWKTHLVDFDYILTQLPANRRAPAVADAGAPKVVRPGYGSW